MNYYKAKHKYIRMAALGVIAKLVKIYQEHKHNFWSRTFEEYAIMLKKINIDSSKKI